MQFYKVENKTFSNLPEAIIEANKIALWNKERLAETVLRGLKQRDNTIYKI